MSQFEIPQNLTPLENIIKVIGVGGGGSNAAKHLYNLNVKNVDFIVCNTDLQHLNLSPIPNKIQLGKNLTKGLGAGCKPEIGKEAAIESKEEIKKILEQGTEMLFITAGLGGGTGTGAAPIIAEISKKLGILTVAVVTLPFKFEGKKKMQYAEEGLEELKKYVDSIIVIPNEKLKELFPGMKMTDAFAKADDVVATAAKSIAEIITNNLHINVDFNDVRTVLQNSGTAIMGTAIARGENRAVEALNNAINNPLLITNSIKGSKNILLSITTGTEDITTEEFEAITNYIEEASDGTAEIIPGYGTDPSLGDAVSITIVATGFDKDISFTTSENTNINLYTVKKVEEVNLSSTTESIETSKLNEEIPNIQSTYTSHHSNIQIEVITNSPKIDDDIKSENKDLNTLFDEVSNYTISHEKPKETISVTETPISDETSSTTSSTELSSDENYLNIPSDTSENSTFKIIDKSTSNVVSNLKENIDKLSELNNKRRTRIIDIYNPEKLKELEDVPAYIRNKNNTETEKPTNKLNTNNDHSNYTIDENGNIKPGNPYLDDQVD